MGNGSSREKKDAKAITKKSVQAQKIERARATGILSLKGCKLKQIPADVFAIPTLHTLDLSQNAITELPPQITELTALKTLKVDGNQLVELPDLSALVKLTTLAADNNTLTRIGALAPNLTKLTLRGNKLTTLPESVCTLTALETLDVAQNAIRDIPNSIGECVQLKEFNIDSNKLQYVPSALTQCTKLTSFFARHNELGPQSFAPEFLHGSAVNVMQLEGNPLTKLDLEAMDGAQAFMERRKILKDKEIHGGLSTDVSLCGLD
ncbi:unnamed protein product [Aphanomyces euteiches]|uniref:Uncharacterized protein n=1 Tax=Aphanomyces euteiches TaxID=100861 RepID=A0A6G0WCG6_9STRA|nr:hypothetical protein Ae201684_016697 [Aphanomyces euteiches]KAH9140655.1 hypothetical protein AeRB84_015126 [Aphanomyces euteiches]